LVSANTLKTAQQRKGQDHTPVLRLFKITAQQIGHRPDKRSRLRKVSVSHETLGEIAALVQMCSGKYSVLEFSSQNNNRYEGYLKR
jgi:hypothetical protein